MIHRRKRWGCFPEIEHPELGAYRSVNIPMRFGKADVKPRGPAPGIGADTNAVLSELGISAEELSQLAANGIVRSGDAS